jgi:hypothetical protein
MQEKENIFISLVMSTFVTAQQTNKPLLFSLKAIFVALAFPVTGILEANRFKRLKA